MTKTDQTTNASSIEASSETIKDMPGAGSEFFEAREALATGETHRLTAEELAVRKKRNWAILGGCLLFIVLVYFVTVTRIAGGIEKGRELNGGPVIVG